MTWQVLLLSIIWWGMFSSHIQALIERLDYIDTWSLDDNFILNQCLAKYLAVL